MAQFGKHFVVTQIGNKFVVVDRELWRQDSESSLATLIGRSILHSMHDHADKAAAVCAAANEILITKR